MACCAGWFWRQLTGRHLRGRIRLEWPRVPHHVLFRFGTIFVTLMDFQFLLGLLLYFGASPIVRMALQNMSVAMKDHELRFFAVEHTTYMFLAVVCAHLGAVLARRGKTDRAKYRGAAISYVISVLLILAGIPWWRPLFRFGA